MTFSARCLPSLVTFYLSMIRGFEFQCSDVKQEYQHSCCGASAGATLQIGDTLDSCDHQFNGQSLGGDKLDLVVVGHSSPLSDPRYAQSCMAVIAGDHSFLVDVGDGCAERYGSQGYNLPLRNLSVLLTHYHSDHIADLGELQLSYRLSGANTPLRVIGPPGVTDIVSAMTAVYAHDTHYRVAHHNTDAVTVVHPNSTMQAVEHALPAMGESAIVYTQNGLSIAMFQVDHSPVSPAVGYRFDYKGRSLTIGGDTVYAGFIPAILSTEVIVQDILDKQLTRMIAGALAGQGLKLAAKIFSDIASYHATVEEVARIIEESAVKHVVLTHVVPDIPQRLSTALLRTTIKSKLQAQLNNRSITADIDFADEGMRVSLPVATTDIFVTRGFTPWDVKCIASTRPLDAILASPSSPSLLSSPSSPSSPSLPSSPSPSCIDNEFGQLTSFTCKQLFPMAKSCMTDMSSLNQALPKNSYYYTFCPATCFTDTTCVNECTTYTHAIC